MNGQHFIRQNLRVVKRNTIHREILPMVLTIKTIPVIPSERSKKQSHDFLIFSLSRLAHHICGLVLRNLDYYLTVLRSLAVRWYSRILTRALGRFYFSCGSAFTFAFWAGILSILTRRTVDKSLVIRMILRDGVMKLPGWVPCVSTRAVCTYSGTLCIRKLVLLLWILIVPCQAPSDGDAY